MNKRFLYSLVTFCFIQITAYSQGQSKIVNSHDDIKFEHVLLGHKSQLFDVHCILQDQQGFMWFGTDEGLYKYNGYDYIAYRHDVFDNASISSNMVNNILEDHSGNIWVATHHGGLNKYDRNNEKFIRFTYNPEDPTSIHGNQIYALHEDHSGTLWVGTDYALNRLNAEEEVFIRYYPHGTEWSGNPDSNHVMVIYEDRYGDLWIGTHPGGLSILNRTTGKFKRFMHDHINPRSLSSNFIQVIYEDSTGTLWIGTANGLNNYDRKSKEFVRFLYDSISPPYLTNTPPLLPAHDIRSIHMDGRGTLWIGTVNGLCILNPNTGKFKRFVNNPEVYYSLTANPIASIYEDNTGVIWIGTGEAIWTTESQGYGVNRFDPEKQQFRRLFLDSNFPNGLNQIPVWTTFEDQSGLIWFGTEGSGMFKFNRKTGQFNYYLNNPHDRNSLSQNSVMSIHEDSHGILWIGTTEMGLNRFDPIKNNFVHYSHDPNYSQSLSDNRVGSIHEDHKGILWMTTWGGGLNRFNRETGTFTRYMHDKNDPRSLGSNYCGEIYEDSYGTLWIATEWVGGLNRFNRTSGNFTRYVHDPNDPQSISHTWVSAILEDRGGNFWVGTRGGGLNKLDRTSGKFEHYTEREGLADNMITGILEDDRGRLWLATGNGLSNFEPRSGKFRNYNVIDGLVSNKLSGLCFKSKSGELVFGSEQGFIIFHPDSIKDNHHIPPIVITKFTRYNSDLNEGQAIIETGITEKDQLELSYKDYFLNFEFAALNYRNSNKNQYAYELEGINDNWIHIGTERELTFTNLSPGNYVLRVKGSNNDGIWNEEGTSIKLIILPPWWKTWWAYTMYALLVVGLIYSARRYELKRIMTRNELKVKKIEADKLLEVDRMKSHFFENISHEFRTPLTLISGPIRQMLSGEFIGNTKEHYQMILRNCKRLLQLVNQLLDLSKFESGKMKLQTRPENIVELTRQLTMNFESLATIHNIELRFDSPVKSIIVYLERQHYEKIITNLLFNAFKFTPDGGSIIVDVTKSAPVTSSVGGKLRIHKGTGTEIVRQNFQYVKIVISDTGKGIAGDHLPFIFDHFYQVGDSYADDTAGSGIGLSLTKELVDLHHGTIDVSSEIGKGTAFTILFHLGKDHLKPEEILDTAQDILPNENYNVFIPAQKPMQKMVEKTTSSKDDMLALIVEDNADMRSYIRNVLNKKYKILEAVDGRDGIEKAVECLPDIIISDVMMPEMDGFQFCRKIKTDEQTSHIPVILLTARATVDSKVEGLEIGADDYLTKPFDVTELEIRVKNLIDQRRKLRERFSKEFHLKPKEIVVNSVDERFLEKAKNIIEENIANALFSVEDFAGEIGLSTMQLYRKVTALTNLSPNEFIKYTRLTRAKELILKNFGNISEIAYEVGFNNPSYFSECFRKQFGCSPSELKKTQSFVTI